MLLWCFTEIISSYQLYALIEGNCRKQSLNYVKQRSIDRREYIVFYSIVNCICSVTELNLFQNKFEMNEKQKKRQKISWDTPHCVYIMWYQFEDGAQQRKLIKLWWWWRWCVCVCASRAHDHYTIWMCVFDSRSFGVNVRHEKQDKCIYFVICYVDFENWNTKHCTCFAKQRFCLFSSRLCSASLGHTLTFVILIHIEISGRSIRQFEDI